MTVSVGFHRRCPGNGMGWGVYAPPTPRVQVRTYNIHKDGGEDCAGDRLAIGRVVPATHELVVFVPEEHAEGREDDDGEDGDDDAARGPQVRVCFLIKTRIRLFPEADSFSLPGPRVEGAHDGLHGCGA